MPQNWSTEVINTVLQAAQIAAQAQRTLAQAQSERAALAQRDKQHRDVMRLREEEFELQKRMAAAKADDPTVWGKQLNERINLVSANTLVKTAQISPNEQVPVPPSIQGLTMEEIETGYLKDGTDLETTLIAASKNLPPAVQEFYKSKANTTRILDALAQKKRAAVEADPGVRQLKYKLGLVAPQRGDDTESPATKGAPKPPPLNEDNALSTDLPSTSKQDLARARDELNTSFARVKNSPTPDNVTQYAEGVYAAVLASSKEDGKTIMDDAVANMISVGMLDAFNTRISKLNRQRPSK